MKYFQKITLICCLLATNMCVDAQTPPKSTKQQTIDWLYSKFKDYTKLANLFKNGDPNPDNNGNII